MASENPEVVVAPVVENGGAKPSSAKPSSKGKEEQSLESELSKKLEITEDAKEENNEEEEGSKGEYFILSVLIDHVVLSFCVSNSITH